jgi:hypothetical protein
MPRRERRRQRRSLVALSEAHDIGMMFPWVRPRDDVVDAFAAQAALMTERESLTIPQELIDQGVSFLDNGERQRIVGQVRARYPDRWQSLVAATGDEGLTERTVIASAVKCAVIERLPMPRGMVELVEAMPAPASPCGVLVIVLDASLIWERDDAIVIGRSVPRTRDPMAFYTDAHALADRRVERWHLDRVRELAGRIEAQLPVVGLPRASRLLESGVAELQADDEAATWVVGALLAEYARLVHEGTIERV